MLSLRSAVLPPLFSALFSPAIFAITDDEQPVIEGTANSDPIAAINPEEALISSIQFPEGMVAKLFASEPNVQDPTSITIDEKGRVYIAETHRFERGVEDNRRIGARWVKEDYQLTSTAERLAMYQRHMKGLPDDYFTKYSEKIRVIEDTNNDGVADTGKIFADGFNHPLDGTAAGVMALDGKIYFACIPHIWMLEDKDGDLVADSKTSLQKGYGISVSLSGHDLNGFAIGPDNRIYFTIGDRGYNLKTKEGKHLYAQYSGAIFRMERDGSKLEEVHTGLRNPKELAFDQFGNAFSVDNNADMGDKARVVDMVEGADSGWHRGNQAFQKFQNYVNGRRRHGIPWMLEGQWTNDDPLRPEAILPPSGYVSAGPSGLAYNPGTGLAEKWDNHFFICDFVGGNSAVIGFRMQPKGAGFEVEKYENFVSGFLNTDIEFGYDGKAYVSDYVGSWTTHGFGNIFTFHDPKETAKPVIREVTELFANSFHDLPQQKLAKLLRHIDMRVRLRAQFSLSEDVTNRDIFLKATASTEAITTRLHGVWGLGNLARLKLDTKSAKLLVQLTTDPDARVRGQSIQALGAANFKKAADTAAAMLKDTEPRVQMLAAIALGKLGTKAHTKQLFELIKDNNDTDEYVRHGAIEGLIQLGNADHAYRFATAQSPAVRRAVVLTLRRFKDKRIASFLKDKDLTIAIEAAQAINDTYLEEAREELAAATHLLGKESWMVDLRILNSMYRSGGDKNVRRLLAVAKNDSLAIDTRAEAMFLLNRWETRSPVDLSTGKHRPFGKERSLENMHQEINKTVLPLLTSGAGDLLVESLSMAAKTNLAIPLDSLLTQVRDPDVPTNVRIAALQKIEKDKPDILLDLLPGLTGVKDLKIKKTVFDTLHKYAPEKAVKAARKIATEGTPKGQQVVYGFLSELKDAESEAILLEKMANLQNLPSAVQLDVIQALEKRATPAAKEAFTKYTTSLDPADPLAAFQVTLAGGVRRNGRKLFFGKAGCVQCHKIGNRGGDAGPNLKGLGKRRDIHHILESIVMPSAKPTIGYSTITLNLKSGKSASGILQKQTDDEIIIQDQKTKEDKTYATSEITNIAPFASTMPPMGLVLAKSEVRDLLEFLSLIE